MSKNEDWWHYPEHVAPHLADIADIHTHAWDGHQPISRCACGAWKPA